MKLQKLITICIIVCFVSAAAASAGVIDLVNYESRTVTPDVGPTTTFERYDPDPATGTGNFLLTRPTGSLVRTTRVQKLSGKLGDIASKVLPLEVDNDECCH